MSSRVVWGARVGELAAQLRGPVGDVVAVLWLVAFVFVLAAASRSADGSPALARAQPGWRTRARRILLVLALTVVIEVLARAVCGAVVGGIIGAQYPSAWYSTIGALAASAVAGFLGRYDIVVLFVSLALAVWGSITGYWPGMSDRADGRGTVEGGVWPPPPKSSNAG